MLLELRQNVKVLEEGASARQTLFEEKDKLQSRMIDVQASVIERLNYELSMEREGDVS